MDYYEPRLPCDATQIGRFRRLLGEDGLEQLINYPAPRGGVLEQRSLAIFVQLGVLVTLVPHIFSDHVLVPVLAHCAGEVPVAPKLTTPKLILHLWASLEYLSRSQTLEQRIFR